MPKPATKCLTCNKKLGLTGFECKCGGDFCAAHRHAEDHECTYNYKVVAVQQLSTIMVSCVPDKMTEGRI